MAREVSGTAALLTSSLLAQTARLHAELAAVIERSRDLCWWAGEVRAGAGPSGRRALGGGGPDDDAGVLVTMITEISLCRECISHRSGIPMPRVTAILSNIAGSIALSVATRPCAACLGTKKTYCLEGAPAHAGTRETMRSNGTQHAILNFLGQQPGSAFCADCIATKLFPGKNIDVAMRHLEGSGMYRRHGRCTACEKMRLVASLPSAN